MVLNIRITGESNLIKGYAYAPSAQEPNKLLVKFPSNPFPAHYDIWTTDYKTFSVVYSCTTIIPQSLKAEFIWILSRTKTLDSSKIAELRDILIKNNISVSSLRAHRQDC